MHNQDQREITACILVLSLLSLFYTIQGLLLIIKMGLPTSINTIKTISHKHAKRLISKVSLDFAKNAN